MGGSRTIAPLMRTLGAGRSDFRLIGAPRSSSPAPSAATTETNGVAAKAAIEDATKQRRDTVQQLHPW